MITRAALAAALALGLLIAPLAAQAKVPRIGVLAWYGPNSRVVESFQQAFRVLGYVEGQNIIIDYRWAKGNLDKVEALAAELVRLKVDVIIALPTPAVRAAKAATSKIPIVMAPAGDPVGTGLVTNLAQPGGNVTGLSSYSAELGGKRLEALRAILPGLHHVAALAHATDPFAKPFLEQMRAAAQTIGLTVEPFTVRDGSEMDGVFAAIAKRRLGAVVVQPILGTREAAALALRHRIATISEFRSFAEGGGLMGYGASYPEIYRKAAIYVDKILKGA